jgi:hypothetical protein
VILVEGRGVEVAIADVARRPWTNVPGTWRALMPGAHPGYQPVWEGSEGTITDDMEIVVYGVTTLDVVEGAGYRTAGTKRVIRSTPTIPVVLSSDPSVLSHERDKTFDENATIAQMREAHRPAPPP